MSSSPPSSPTAAAAQGATTLSSSNGAQPAKSKRNRISVALDIITRPRRNSTSGGGGASASSAVVSPVQPTNNGVTSTAFQSLLSAQRHVDRSPVVTSVSPTPASMSPASFTATPPAAAGCVFGSKLPTDPAKLHNGVPLVVYRCVECLSKRGIETEGIFRVPASQVEVRNIKAMYDRGEDPDLEAIVRTPHVAPALLKLYLRELPEPLLTAEYYDMFIVAAGISDVPERLRRIQKIMLELPEVHFNTIYFLTSFLRQVAAKSDKNKMDAVNLSTVIVPNIIKNNLSIAEETKDVPLARTLLLNLINNFDTIFEGLSGPKPMAIGTVAPAPIFVSVTAPSPVTASSNLNESLAALNVLDTTSPTVWTSSGSSTPNMTTASSPTPEPYDLPLSSSTSSSPANGSVVPSVGSPSAARKKGSKTKSPQAPTIASNDQTSESSTGPNTIAPVNSVSSSSELGTNPSLGARKVKSKDTTKTVRAISPTQELGKPAARRKSSKQTGAGQNDETPLPHSHKNPPLQRSVSEKSMLESRQFVSTVQGDEFLRDVAKSRLDDVKRRLSEGSVFVNCTNENGWTALMYAVCTNDFVMVKELITAGCSVNAQNDRGETALYKAAATGSVESAESLLAAGANVHLRDGEGRSPIIIAAFAGEKLMCSLLLKHGAALNDADHLTNKTPLIFATYNEHGDTVELLLQLGADPNAADTFGWTALLMAAHKGNERIVRMLLQHRASVTKTTKKGKTATNIAIEAGFPHIVEILTHPPTSARARARKSCVIEAPSAASSFAISEGAARSSSAAGAGAEKERPSKSSRSSSTSKLTVASPTSSNLSA